MDAAKRRVERREGDRQSGEFNRNKGCRNRVQIWHAFVFGFSVPVAFSVFFDSSVPRFSRPTSPLHAPFDFGFGWASCNIPTCKNYQHHHRQPDDLAGGDWHGQVPGARAAGRHFSLNRCPVGQRERERAALPWPEGAGGFSEPARLPNTPPSGKLSFCLICCEIRVQSVYKSGLSKLPHYICARVSRNLAFFLLFVLAGPRVHDEPAFLLEIDNCRVQQPPLLSSRFAAFCFGSEALSVLGLRFCQITRHTNLRNAYMIRAKTNPPARPFECKQWKSDVVSPRKLFQQANGHAACIRSESAPFLSPSRTLGTEISTGAPAGPAPCCGTPSHPSPTHARIHNRERYPPANPVSTPPITRNEPVVYSTKSMQGNNPNGAERWHVPPYHVHSHHGVLFSFLDYAPALRPQQAVVESVMACEREQQAQLLSGVVLAGGGCCFEGLAERLKAEIEVSLDVPSTGWRVKVLAAGSHERK